MNIAELKAHLRHESGSRACRRIRKRALIPAVLYGRGRPNVLLNIPKQDIEKLLHAHSFIVRVKWDGGEETAQLKDIQYDALGDTLLHVDLMRISLTETIRVTVPVETHGEAEGVKLGGVLDQLVHELEVECLPTLIPQKLRLDVTHLQIGQEARVRDVSFPEGVKPVADPEMVVALIKQPTEITEEAAPEEERREPEVIGRKATEEAEEEEETGG